MDKEKIEIIKKAKLGDKNALEKLIKEEQSAIYTMLYYLKKDDNEIKDIMQNVLIKLSTKIRQLNNVKHFKTWLNQIVINSYYDYLRKYKKKELNLTAIDEDVPFEIPDYDSNPQNAILYNELDYVIKTSIENLPIHYKIPITLREIQGLSYDEISSITKTTIGTVKSRIARARSMIKNQITKYKEG